VKILILNWKSPTDAAAGGAERYVLEVATRWADDGHEVTIFGPRTEANPTAVLNGSPKLRYVGAGSRLTVFRAADRYLRRSGDQFDWVLESVSTRPFAAHRVVGDRAVALYHQTAEEVWAMEYPFPISWIGRTMLEPAWIRRLLRGRVVANSPSTAASLARYGITVEAIVPPGCDPPRSREARTAPGIAPRLLWMGRLVRTKRPEDALAAFQLVREVLPAATLDLIGGGYLEASIRGQNYPGVTVHGFVPEDVKISLVSRADLLLLPGTREGWGIVAMEAASCGVPVVAYDVPGLRDAVSDGVTGMVVPADPDALGAAAARLLQSPDRWVQLSSAGQQRAQELTWDRTAQNLLLALSSTHLEPENDPLDNSRSRGTSRSRSVSSAASLQLFGEGNTLEKEDQIATYRGSERSRPFSRRAEVPSPGRTGAEGLGRSGVKTRQPWRNRFHPTSQRSHIQDATDLAPFPRVGLPRLSARLAAAGPSRPRGLYSDWNGPGALRYRRARSEGGCEK
jgi:glycosyltransferase involved in cell wall biosynthesis